MKFSTHFTAWLVETGLCFVAIFTTTLKSAFSHRKYGCKNANRGMRDEQTPKHAKSKNSRLDTFAIYKI